MCLFSTSNDPVKLAESIHKKIDLSRTHLKPSLLPSLALLLPSSPYAATLSDLPLPEPTTPGAKPSTITNVQHVVHTLEGGLDLLEEIVKGWEKEELEVRSKEIDKRRTRITGGRSKTRSQIEREVFAEFAKDSHLPGLYSQLLNHPSLSVERLREVEHALLLHRRTLLFSISSKDKETKRVERKKVQELSQGVVLIRGADRDAWEAQLEWSDWTSIGPCNFSTSFVTSTLTCCPLRHLADEYPLADLKAFTKIFPNDPLTWFITGYLMYFGLQDPEEEEGQAGGRGSKKSMKPKVEEDEAVGDDAFKLLYVRTCPLCLRLKKTSLTCACHFQEGIDALSESLLCHRILSHILLLEGDHVSAISLCNTGLKLTTTLANKTGLAFPKSELAFKTTLGTSYTHFYSPKHHKSAEPLLREVLDKRPDDARATLGMGYILSARASWDEAMEYFNKVIASVANADNPVESRMLQEAREESAWCKAKSGRSAEGKAELDTILAELDASAEVYISERDAMRAARVAWRLGTCVADLQEGQSPPPLSSSC